MSAKPLPTKERLHELLRYDPETGYLLWRIDRGGRRAARVGDRAGTTTPLGYRAICIDRLHHLEHRVIWKMHTGADPEKCIDHIDGNSLNNKLGNLRLANVSENLRNSRLRSDSSTGIKGISFDHKRLKWRAVIMVQQKYIQVGRFSNLDDAVRELGSAREKYHGDFARSA